MSTPEPTQREQSAHTSSALRPSEAPARQALTVALCGLALSVLVSVLWSAAVSRDRENRLQAATTQAGGAISGQLSRHEDAVLATAALFADGAAVGEEEFTRFSRTIDLQERLGDTRGLAHLRRDSDGRATLYRWNEGSPWPQLTRGGVVTSPPLTRALRTAVETRRPVLAGGVAGRTPQDVVIVAPVVSGLGAQARVTGWSGLWISGSALRARWLPVGDPALRVSLRPDGAMGGGAIGEPAVPGSGPVKRFRLPSVGGTSWTVEVQATSAFSSPISRYGPIGLLVGGVLVSIITALLVERLSRARMRATGSAVRAARELQGSEARFQTLANASPLGIFHVDRDGTLVYANDRCNELLHLTSVTLAEDRPSLPDVFHPDDRAAAAAAWHRASVTGEEVSVELRSPVIGPEERWVNVRAARMPDEGGRVAGWVGSVEDITSRRQYEQRLSHQALHDELTGLPNRTLLVDRLRLALRRARREQGAVALLFIDLDRFKAVNDSLGHAGGDALLISVADRLRELIRPGDTAGRFAGDEFVIVCDRVQDEEQALLLAERIADGLRAPVRMPDGEIEITASVGVALSNAETLDAEELLRDADTAMYRAKELGKARAELFHRDMHEEALERLRIETGLRRALDHDHLELHYQPKIRLADGAVVGLEALVRWNDPDHGLIGPGVFIPIAEESGLIGDIGAWALDAACAQLAVWRDRHPSLHLNMAVNLSARQLQDERLPSRVAQAINSGGLSPGIVCLEITESALMDDAERGARTLAILRSLGLTLSIDDFGTGYSSLSYLQAYAVDELKIDRSFVSRLGQDSDATALAATIIGMAEALGLSVVAEGIETPEQLAVLRRLHCTTGQGFLFSRPLPPAELEGLLEAGRVELGALV